MCFRKEAEIIFGIAREEHVTGKGHVWIVSQSIVGDLLQEKTAPSEFPIGLMGEFQLPVFDPRDHVQRMRKLRSVDSGQEPQRKKKSANVFTSKALQIQSEPFRPKRAGNWAIYRTLEKTANPICAFCHTPPPQKKITLSHWLFFLG